MRAAPRCAWTAGTSEGNSGHQAHQRATIYTRLARFAGRCHTDAVLGTELPFGGEHDIFRKSTEVHMAKKCTVTKGD